MDDLLRDFLTETQESLAVLDTEVVALEQDPTNSAILQDIFRLMHTIKGTCGFLGLARLERVAHSAEGILAMIRDAEMTVSPAAVTEILQALDRIKWLLGRLEQNGQEPEGDDSDLLAALDRLKTGEAAPSIPPPVPQVPQDEPPQGPAQTAEIQAAEPPAVARVPVAANKESGEPPAREVRPGETANQAIRVSVDLLESLMTLVSELVLTRNQLIQMVRGKDSEFTAPVQRLSLITSDIQEGVMRTRMQPIGNAWATLPRLVRDLCQETGKKVDLQMSGSETDLDRQVLEMIKDPLTHMVRNAIDHGIEAPAQRLQTGKPETGLLSLTAFHEGGHILIRIADDGQGLMVDRIKARIMQQELATETELRAMAEPQILQYIFKPGFSTAERVTSVSGRGVGMDVVRTNIERIGGTIDFASTVGRGTTFTIKIPLTLAIVSALIIEAAGERFAVPQISVSELVRASPRSEQKVEWLNDAPVLRLRDRLLPLISLAHILHRDRGTDNGAPIASKASDDLFIVVCQVGAFTFGIIVDRVFDTEEIVVKPVAPMLKDIALFSGNTILGDGSVIMILDPNGIAAAASQMAISRSQNQDAAVGAPAPRAHDDRATFLIFRAGETDELKAVPLALVARLEEFNVGKIEHSHGKPVYQYRGHLMPLLPVRADHVWKNAGRQPVLVFVDGPRSMGLVVDEIVDIVEDRMQVELSADREGVLGTAIIRGKATDVIDVGYYLRLALADWFGPAGTPYGDNVPAHPRLLIVDDSAFFRNLITPQLVAEGWQVIVAKSADEALSLRDEGQMFDAVISDIEMPGMNGYEFARSVRQDGVWSTVPLIALSAHTAERDLARGRSAGFDDYVSKSDYGRVSIALQEAIKRKQAEGLGGVS
ncbi:MAG: chemotaxis protein CheW [Rhodospirillales bacterium]|nr:chemotaxis protein CheW [Rhodospirillales bacterium]